MLASSRVLHHPRQHESVQLAVRIGIQVAHVRLQSLADDPYLHAGFFPATGAGALPVTMP